MRRLLALTLLTLISASSTEAVVGVIRDGAVHHENAAVAAVHAQESGGDHGHEDTASGEHSHDEGHDHGTASDHCTHTHGAAVLTSSLPPLVFETAEYHFTESVRPHALVSDGFTHPPRA